jgi:hypothetical protein
LTENTCKSIPIAAFVLLALSCATNPKKYREVDLAVANQDYRTGIEVIVKGQEKNNPVYPQKNAIMLYLDKGLLEHYAGNYTGSSNDLQNAERLIEEAYTKSITADFASYILNDNTKEYPGEDFEDIYINIFNALNYYNRGDLEGALVEIRKLSISSGKLDMLSRKYEDASAGFGEKALEQFKRSGFNFTESLPRGLPVNFSNSALARYLGALFYLAEGNEDGARIEFEALQNAFDSNEKIYRNPLPQAALDVQSVPQEKARLNVIAFTGLSPVKEKGFYPQYWFFMQSPVLQVPVFKLPKLVDRPSIIDRIEVIAGENKFDLELLEDMGAVVKETFNARFSNVFFKTYIRVFLKYAAADISAAIANERDSGAALLIALGARAALDASEDADIRMSRYLPDKAYIGGVNLDSGTYDVTVKFYSGMKLAALAEYKNVIVKTGGLNLIESVSLK